MQHPLEVKQHKATANRSVPLLDLCLSPESLHLCVGRRLGDDIDPVIRNKLRDATSYQPVLVFPKLNTDVVSKVENGQEANESNHIFSLVELIAKLKGQASEKVGGGSILSPGEAVDAVPKKKILLLVLDATWKYSREMHMANQKYRQYPPHMLRVALDQNDLDLKGTYQPRRFEIRGKVSATGGKKAAQEEDATTTWMCTAECVSLIVSRLEEKLGTHPQSAEELHEIIMKPLDAMVAKWKAFLNSPKTRKHDLQRGMSKKEKRRKRQQEQQQTTEKSR